MLEAYKLGAEHGARREPKSSCPYLYSSDCWLAYHAGYQSRPLGLPDPVKVTAGRGQSVRLWWGKPRRSGLVLVENSGNAWKQPGFPL